MGKTRHNLAAVRTPPRAAAAPFLAAPFLAGLWFAGLSAIGLCLNLGLPETAQAQSSLNGGFDLRLFRPAADARGFISVDGAEVTPHLKYGFGLTMDAGFSLLRYQGFENDAARPADEAIERFHVLDRLFTGHLHAHLGLFDWFSVGLQVPFHLASGPNMTVLDAGGVTLNGPPDTGAIGTQTIGDIQLILKARLFDPPSERFGMAAVMQIAIPTGSPEQFVGEPGFSMWPKLVAEVRPISWFRFGANLGYRLNTGDGASFPVNGATTPGAPSGNATGAILADPGTPITYDDLVTFGAAAAFRVLPKMDLIGELYGSWLASESGNQAALSSEVLGGVKIFVAESSFLMLAGGPGLPPATGFQSAKWRGVMSITYEPQRIQDRDGDGIEDSLDRCPDEPEDRDGFEDEDGCPDPDNDGDGILDAQDVCPDLPEDMDGVADHDGCPEGISAQDRDGDGIPDAQDACPDQPEDFDKVEDSDGCPDLDNDNDGIPDDDDACPGRAEDMDGFQDDDGCPEDDNDNDRILDVDDACPNEPEVYNGFEDEDGCPDEGSVVIEDDQLVILDKIYFKTGSSEIESRSTPILQAVAATFRGNPSIRRVEVQGHADERGPAQMNFDLTSARAASVVQALVDLGVKRERLRSRGYGEACPLKRGHSPAAWEKNRRVEFKILATQDGPAEGPVACKAGLKLYGE